MIVYAALSGGNGGIWRSARHRPDLAARCGPARHRPRPRPQQRPSTPSATRAATSRSSTPPSGARASTSAPTGPGLQPDGRRHRRPADPGRRRSRQPDHRSSTPARHAQRRQGPDRPGQAGPDRRPGAQDLVYEGWLYAAVVDPSGHFDGLYLTKDFGQNWTKVRIPTVPPIVTGGVAKILAVPTNDDTKPDYDVGGGPPAPACPRRATTTSAWRSTRTTPTSSTSAAPPTASRPASSGSTPPGSTTPTRWSTSDQDNPDGGQLDGNATDAGPAVRDRYDRQGDDPDLSARTPTSTSSATRTTRSAPTRRCWSRNATNVHQHRRRRHVDPLRPSAATDQHRIVTFVDPLTGHARLIFGDDQGVFTGRRQQRRDRHRHRHRRSPPPAAATATSRSPSSTTARRSRATWRPRSRGDLFYGSAQDNGGPRRRDPNVLTNGNITWGGPGGDATGVATDQQGRGTAVPVLVALLRRQRHRLLPGQRHRPDLRPAPAGQRPARPPTPSGPSLGGLELRRQPARRPADRHQLAGRAGLPHREPGR